MKSELSLDPCMKVHCGAGRVCEVDEVGEPQCVCIPECPVETESRRKVCSNHNETWTSDCAVYQQRCLCNIGDDRCKGEEYKHVHIEYYGACRDTPVSRFLKFVELTMTLEKYIFSFQRNVQKTKRQIFLVVCATGSSTS